ncbi:MAG: ABC transporter permease, partial [Demequina sp.]|nr:ABC transporter permease [Demequina sp.]
RPMIVGTLVVLASFSLFIAILAVSLIITSADPRIVQVFTLFPYTAPVTALLRNAFGSLPLWMAIVDIVVMFVLAAIVLQVAVRIFKYGSIEYGKKVSLRGAFAARSNP